MTFRKLIVDVSTHSQTMIGPLLYGLSRGKQVFCASQIGTCVLMPRAAV